jgi:hypothetical protein
MVSGPVRLPSTAAVLEVYPLRLAVLQAFRTMVMGSHPPLPQLDREVDHLPAVQPVEHCNPRVPMAGIFLLGVMQTRVWGLRLAGWEQRLVDWLEWVVWRNSSEAGERGKMEASNNRGDAKNRESLKLG